MKTLKSLEMVQEAVNELFKELKKKCGDWGVINDGLIELTKLINQAKKS